MDEERLNGLLRQLIDAAELRGTDYGKEDKQYDRLSNKIDRLKWEIKEECR